jgi:hypothetical protein
MRPESWRAAGRVELTELSGFVTRLGAQLAQPVDKPSEKVEAGHVSALPAKREHEPNRVEHLTARFPRSRVEADATRPTEREATAAPPQGCQWPMASPTLAASLMASLPVTGPTPCLGDPKVPL